MTRQKTWFAAIGVVIVFLVILGAACGDGTRAAPPSSVPAASSTPSTRPLGVTSSSVTAGSPGPVGTTTAASSPSASGEVAAPPTTGVSAAIATPTGLVQVHYIDVGQGDSILIRSPEGKVMLIDGGVAGSPALEYLNSLGLSHVDVVVATHPHPDHIGGLVDVLNALKVSEVVTNGQPTTTKIYEQFLDGIAHAKAVYKEVKRGDKLTLGSLTFDVLSPEGSGGDDLNEGSLVLRLVFGRVAFLFTGDAGQTAEANMLAAGEDVQAQILKVGHHGSSSACSPEFLTAVQPEVAIYSCGVGNSHDYPHAETLAALAEVGAKVYGTDVNGTVVVTSDGLTYQVRGERGEARGPPLPATTPTSSAV